MKFTTRASSLKKMLLHTAWKNPLLPLVEKILSDVHEINRSPHEPCIWEAAKIVFGKTSNKDASL